MIFTDQLKHKLLIENYPKRIVSLVPSLTELLVDLDLENQLVGMTKFCVHPKHLRHSKVIVGGTKQIKVDSIKELRPDIILCNKEENTLDMVEELKGIAPIHISDVNNLEDCFELIEMYGDLFDKKVKAYNLIRSIKKVREDFRVFLREKSQKSLAYFIWKDPWMVAASNTFISHMIEEAGFKNTFNYETRYPEINLNNQKLKDSDLIFLSSEPYPFKDEHLKVMQAVFPDKKIHIVNGEMFSWYGSHLLNAYHYFKTLH